MPMPIVVGPSKDLSSLIAALVARRLPADSELGELAAGLGLTQRAQEPRSARAFATTLFGDATGNQLRVEKDHVLGQCVVRASGPRGAELRAAVATALGEWTIEEVL